MGLISGAASVMQFAVYGAPPAEDSDGWLGRCLAGDGFRNIDETADEESIGWVQFDDNLVAGFAHSGTFRRDHFVIAALRKDQRKLPGFLVRRLYARECETWLNQHPHVPRVPRGARDEIREQVKLSLLQRTLPTPSIIELIWNTETRTMTAAATSTRAIDFLTERFKLAFTGLTLMPLHPMLRAERVLPEKSHAALNSANEAYDQDVATQIKHNRWLGQDFLRWLLFRTLHSDSRYKIAQSGPASEGDPFTAYLDEKLVLFSESEGKTKRAALSGPQSDYAEARTALTAGKEIAEATVFIEKDELAWQFTLKGELFAFTSFKTPPVKLEDDNLTDPAAERDAVFFERTLLMELGLQMFDTVLAEFLAARLGPKWATLRKEIDTKLAL
jgi:recombination associated protein RdgC